jgi:glycine dehydrogenase subunit 1
VIVQQPNFLGQLEEADRIAALTHAADALSIASVYPLSCGVVAPPGEYEADIACGEGQPLGIPLAYGGPYFGFLATRNKYVRQMPGRLIGQTTDLEGRTGYVLTLQTREQHIRRDKSTSNICTNQFLCALASSVYLCALGKEGLIEVSRQCLEKSRYLRDRLLDVPGVEPVFDGPFFNEFAIRTPRPAAEVLAAQRRQGIVGGYDLGQFDPGRNREILVCATETRTRAVLDDYGRALEAILK